ncbi:Creatinase [Exaiptasia diaphana]|nr:Creatinase [Exaiptasia diaphana]
MFRPRCPSGLRGMLARFTRRSMSSEQQDAHLPRMLKIKNGEKVKPTFSAAEMERRLTMLRTDMENRGIDACVLTSHHNINYFSDFLYCYFGRPYALVVTADKSTNVSASTYL